MSYFSLLLSKHKYQSYLIDTEFLLSLLWAVLLLGASLVVNFFAGLYADLRVSSPVTDIVLSNIRVFDVDIIFIYGFVFLSIFTIFISALEPKRLPFVFKSVALFILIRSVFISLTHIAPFPTHAIIISSFVGRFTFQGDLFFSGHTGLPFLMALIFWDNRALRYFYLASSLFMGIAVLLGHVHYSIDVLAAFFITYTIYHIAEYLFKKDHNLLTIGLQQIFEQAVAGK